MSSQHVTLEQLANLYEARNRANSDLAAAYRVKEPGRLADAKEAALRLNQAYDAARKQHKQQQKAAARASLRTAMIRWYLDQQASEVRVA